MEGADVVTRRKLTIGALLAGAVAVATVVALWQVSKARCFALVGPVTCRLETSRPEVALTFDDGPTPLGVDAILPLLEAHGARATFFMIGEEMARRPELVARLRAGGHELGNHSYSHRQMVGRTEAFYHRELTRTEALLVKAGPSSGLFRPPHGKKLIGLPLAVERHGLRMIMWDIEDPTTADPRKFADQVVASARPGSIILVHAMYPANNTGRRALPLILEGLGAKGLRVVTVGQLLADARRGPAEHPVKRSRAGVG